MRNIIVNAFFTWGWLLPALLPLAQVLGRAVFHIAGVLYLAWALFSLYGQRLELDRQVLRLYGLLIFAFLLSVPGAIDTLRSLNLWFEFTLYSAMCMITLAVLARVPDSIERLIAAFGIAGLAVLAVLYVQLPLQMHRSGFHPTQHLREDNLPLLMPFLLYWTQGNISEKLRRQVAVALIGAAGFYIILSQGRAALLGLLVALGAYAYFVVGWRKRNVLIAVAALLAAAVIASGSGFFRGAAGGSDYANLFDRISSYRTALWRQALTTPPDNPWLGVGMGNVEYAEKVMTVTVIEQGVTIKLKHLHNFLLDAWYQTGVVGLGALLIWLGCLLRRGLLAWRTLSGGKRSQAGVLLAASVSILATALLSFSYNSKQFAIYLFVFLVALAHLHREAQSSVAGFTRRADTP